MSGLAPSERSEHGASLLYIHNLYFWIGGGLKEILSKDKGAVYTRGRLASGSTVCDLEKPNIFKDIVFVNVHVSRNKHNFSYRPVGMNVYVYVQRKLFFKNV